MAHPFTPSIGHLSLRVFADLNGPEERITADNRKVCFKANMDLVEESEPHQAIKGAAGVK